MFGSLLNRWREGKAIRALESSIDGRGPLAAGVKAARDLQQLGSARCVHALCSALTHGPEALRAEAPAALAGVHKRRHDERVPKALSEAILSERQGEVVREAAIGALAEIVSVRHVGSFVELLKSMRTPVRVRTAAMRALGRVGYPEIVERLVESYFLKRTDDPHGANRRWVVEQLKQLRDKEKLTKLHEIAHARRRLRNYVINLESGDAAELVQVMAEVDADQAVRFLSHMVDESTSVISRAAAEALRDIRAKHKEPEPRNGGNSERRPGTS